LPERGSPSNVEGGFPHLGYRLSFNFERRNAVILLVFAFVFFCIAIFHGPTAAPNSPWYGRFNFIAAGLAAWTLSLLLPVLAKLI
jgi:hypothetical protein